MLGDDSGDDFEAFFNEESDEEGDIAPDPPEAPTPDPPSVDVDPDTNPNFADILTNTDREITRAFASAVVLANVGLLGITLGPLLWYFDGHFLTGLTVFTVGAVALYATYRIVQHR